MNLNLLTKGNSVNGVHQLTAGIGVDLPLLVERDTLENRNQNTGDTGNGYHKTPQTTSLLNWLTPSPWKCYRENMSALPDLR